MSSRGFVHKITNRLAVIRKTGCRNCTVCSGVNYSAGIQRLMSAINCPIKEVHVTECISSRQSDCGTSYREMRDTPSSNRDPKLRADRQTDEVVLGEIAPEPIDCWFAGYRGGQGSPAARGSYASVTLTRRCWFWCDSLPPSGTGRSGNYYFGPISFDRNIRSARSARKVSVSVLRLKIATPPRTFGAILASLFIISSGSTDSGGWRSLSRTGRTATTSHRSCHRDVRSWRRDCVRSVTVNWSWSDMVTSARHVPRDCGVRRTSTESEFRLGHFDRLILLSDSKLDPLLNFNIS